MLAITNTFEHGTYDIRWITMAANTAELITVTRAEPGSESVGQAISAALSRPPRGWIPSLFKDATAIWPQLSGYAIIRLKPRTKTATTDKRLRAGIVAPHWVDDEDAHAMLIALETEYIEAYAAGRL